MSTDAIRSLGNGCFYVRSATDLAKMYLVDLSKDSSADMSKSYLIDHGKEFCDCLDWLRVWLCKHIAATAHFFAATPDTQVALEPVPKHSTSREPGVRRERGTYFGEPDLCI